LQREIIIFPKSIHLERMKQNIDLNFILTNDEINKINAMDHNSYDQANKVFNGEG
jgi:diketogulonate reductase-like aldo/keto reductase